VFCESLAFVGYSLLPDQFCSKEIPETEQSTWKKLLGLKSSGALELVTFCRLKSSNAELLELSEIKTMVKKLKIYINADFESYGFPNFTRLQLQLPADIYLSSRSCEQG
jgi:hypothetical protein